MTLHADKDNAVISRERVTDKTYPQQIAPAKEKEEPDDAAEPGDRPPVNQVPTTVGADPITRKIYDEMD
jgi:hypothetical protein